MEWWWLTVALLLGGAGLAVGVVLDWRRERRQGQAATVVPLRGIATVDQHAPTYITQEKIDATPGPAGIEGEPQGVRCTASVAHTDFLPAKGRVGVERARVIVVAGQVTNIRELLPLLAAHDPLLIVAESMEIGLAQTLAANRRALGIPLLACTANAKNCEQVAMLVRAGLVAADDLRAGYVPASAIGFAGHAIADRRSLWIKA